jgi:hypothetical protein
LNTRRKRQAYQVVREEGARSIHLGWKGRVLGWRRANRIRRFLVRRGHDVRVRHFGIIVMPVSPRLFD